MSLFIMRRLIFPLLFFPLLALGQISVRQNAQHCFPDSIPPGNYSGVAWLGNDKYAVVSDKSEEDGFFVFEISTDSTTGEILSARNLGFMSSGQPNRDDEGIAYNPNSNTIFISGEADNVIKEYDMGGKLTGRVISPTPLYSTLPGNLGLEALSYNASTHTLWTCNESGEVIVQSYNDELKPKAAFKYDMDKPVADKAKAEFYTHGIGTLCALDNGGILLLERELYVPKKKIGSFVNCKLYYCLPTPQQAINSDDPLNEAGKLILDKKLLTSWRTSLSVFGRGFANYEGMCLGPNLRDGSRVILLVADSQDQYRHVLKDWMKSLRIVLPSHHELP